MYETRQNKEKVSRIIDGGGMVRQRVRIKYDSLGQHMKGKCIQCVNSIKDISVGLLDIMHQKRINDNFWNHSSLSKNFAFDEKDTDNYAHSQDNRHSEPMVLAQAGFKNNAQNLILVTERAPCSSCAEDIKTCEGLLGKEISVKYFVEHNDYAPSNLFNLYNPKWAVPGRKYS